jgi:plasmid replication initiation protein
MTKDKDEQIDLFLPYMADLSLRDQREMMERPFFSLAKSKRLKPIDYTSPDGKTYVHVSPNPDYGMATIWDADILIYCASVLNDMKSRGVNDIPRTLKIMPYDLLRSINRPLSGRSYELLGQALDRLQSTTIKTNIRAEQNRREATFSWLDNWSQLIDEKNERSKGMSLSLSSWFYEGVLMSGGVLMIDRRYFDITGGRERWLYKVARKHAGGAGEGGFSLSLPTLFEKSGAEGLYRRFKFEIIQLVKRNDLPGFSLSLIPSAHSQEPLLHITKITLEKKPERAVPAAKEARCAVASQTMSTNAANTHLQGPSEPINYLTDETLTYLRQHYRGWDFQALHHDFQTWIKQAPERRPARYQSAFIGFVKRHHEGHKHELKTYNH